MAYKAISKAEVKRFVHEVRKAHDVIIERIYAHKDTVTAANNGLAPKLPDEETKFLNGKGQWVVPPNDVYTLHSASDGELGGVKIAGNTGITIGSSGVISVVPASSSVIGGIKFPTTNINNTYLRGDGTWATPTDTKYTLPVATRDLLGGVIVGDNISVSADGKIGVSVSGDDTTYLRGDGTWATISSDNYKGAISINISTNRNVLAQSIALNGITSTTLETLVPTITSIESPNEGDHYIVANTDPLLDIYEGDYIIYQNHSWKYVKSSGLRSKSLSFKGYITSSEDLTLIATATDDNLSSSTLQSSNSSIGDMWLMQTTLGSLEQGDLILRTGVGETDWKVIHERPIRSESGTFRLGTTPIYEEGAMWIED